MSLNALSKYIILFLFALVIVLGAAIGILSADNRALLKANAPLKEQVAYRDMVISEVQNNIDALKAQAAAIEQSCAKQLKAREDVITLFDIPEREPPPQKFHNTSLKNKKAAGAEVLNSGVDYGDNKNERAKTDKRGRSDTAAAGWLGRGADAEPLTSNIISKTKSDYSIDAINGYIVRMLADIASGAVSE